MFSGHAPERWACSPPSPKAGLGGDRGPVAKILHRACTFLCLMKTHKSYRQREIMRMPRAWSRTGEAEHSHQTMM